MASDTVGHIGPVSPLPKNISLIVNEKEAIFVSQLWALAAAILNKAPGPEINYRKINCQAFYKQLSPDEHIALATKLLEFAAAISSETLAFYGLESK